MASPSLPKKQINVLRGHYGPVLAVKYNANGSYVMSAGQDKMVRLWNPVRGTLVKTYKAHGYEVLDVIINSDNSQFASCGGDRLIFLWDVSTGRVIRKFRGHDQRVNCICYNPGEYSIIVSGSYDKTVRIWDLKSRSAAPIQVLAQARDSISSLVVSPSEIITGSVDGCIRKYDIRMGILATDKLHQPVTNVSLSNDHNCILASCLDSTVRLIDKASGEVLSTYKGHRNTSFKINSCLTNDDAYVVSGSEDKSVYFWDLVESKVVQTLKGHSGIVCGITYHPKQPQLVTCSEDSTIRVWGKS